MAKRSSDARRPWIGTPKEFPCHRGWVGLCRKKHAFNFAGRGRGSSSCGKGRQSFRWLGQLVNRRLLTVAGLPQRERVAFEFHRAVVPVADHDLADALQDNPLLGHGPLFAHERLGARLEREELFLVLPQQVNVGADHRAAAVRPDEQGVGARGGDAEVLVTEPAVACLARQVVSLLLGRLNVLVAGGAAFPLDRLEPWLIAVRESHLEFADDDAGESGSQFSQVGQSGYALLRWLKWVR